ncbi:MAG: HEAT repeat domain-containing protein [Deltaproteobacteria bacterium]|nr:HEAT repeat domain-containing protein [Deltaproteobacteria bacterium]
MDKRKEILITALRDGDEVIRKIAADSLEKLEIRGKLDLIAKKIDTGEMTEKIRAVYALADLKGPRVTELLVKAVTDPLADVRAAAVRVLGGKGESALPHIVKALKDPDTTVARVAVDALGNSSDSRLLGPLMQVLKNTDSGVVEKALDAIGRLGDKRAEEAMVYFAVKGNVRMRSIAIKALGEMDR